LKTIASRLKMGDYYRSKECMVAEIFAMINNCRICNQGPGNECYDAAGEYMW
jgi:hypothetical protein